MSPRPVLLVLVLSSTGAAFTATACQVEPVGEGAPEGREEGVFALPTATSDGASSGPAAQVADGAVAPIDASLAPDTSPTPDAGLDTSSPDAASLDAGVDGDVDAGQADASPDGATTPLVDADFVRALSSPWSLKCDAARVQENYRGGPPGVGRECSPTEQAWVYVTRSKPAFSVNVVASVRGALFVFSGPVPSPYSGAGGTIAQVDASRPLGADGCAAVGTKGTAYSTTTKVGYCKGTPASCAGGSPQVSSYGGATTIRRTTLADGRKLYWLADPLATSVPSSEVEVPSYNYGSCATGFATTGAVAENRLCRFFHVQVP